MCASCGCGDPKNKHGLKSVKAANKKFAEKKTSPAKSKKTSMVKKKGM
jgi:hypothetical protein